MNTQAESTSNGLDTVKLLGAIAIIGGGIFGFYYLSDQPTWVRLLFILVVAAVAVFLLLQTNMGRAFWSFASGARTEVRKVVWPTRQETMQTTLVVFVGVLIMMLFMWAVDSILFWVVKLATGHGG